MCVYFFLLGGVNSTSFHFSLCVCRQEQKDTLQELKDRMDSVQRDRERDAEELRVRTTELRKSMENEERLKKELEVRHQTHTHTHKDKCCHIILMCMWASLWSCIRRSIVNAP